MLLFLKQCGMFGWPLLIISIVNIVLTVVSAIRVSQARPENAARTASGISAILFWGGVSAVLGFLGQHSGLYNALYAISRAKEISPNIVAEGFAQSFTTTIFGMTILVLSALAWFALNAWQRRASHT
jgi:biopolymer transport protein ExbB/TolQ